MSSAFTAIEYREASEAKHGERASGRLRGACAASLGGRDRVEAGWVLREFSGL
jgi:hypothetical protein